ncbi:hypothetical protein KIH74_35055 [Kineosporia sp. J2-2]|uniref:Exonuclease domain-containing protein n=1 Tax=Kineosporia corallincola TaxID=2835133 RepID=A0ABS5TTU4_9ACTN|nr:hypothetical protein [Kineosporia corallincola]
MGRLTEDPAFLATTFVVIDFEATTPTGYPAQPIEVAALALRHRHGVWTEAGRSTSLIRPPDFAPVTPDVTAQNGLTPHQLRDAPHPAQAFATLDQRFAPGAPYLLVAQHAATEANIIYNQREHCPGWPTSTCSTPSRWPSCSSPDYRTTSSTPCWPTSASRTPSTATGPRPMSSSPHRPSVTSSPWLTRAPVLATSRAW